jgi:apolipoprotein N-acyltransferase
MKKQWAVLLSVIGIVGILSTPWAFALLFLIFPLVFYVFQGKSIGKNIGISIVITGTAIIVVFINSFFVVQYYMLLLSLVYFTFLLTADFIIIYKIITMKKTVLPLIFCYAMVTRTLLALNPWCFPFYWTLSMHLLPGMDTVTKIIMPIFLESLMLIAASSVYMVYSKQARKSIYPQIFMLVIICCCVTPTIRQIYVPEKQAIQLSCGMIQGSFTKHDYDLAEKYPALAGKISAAYRQYIADSKPFRLLIVPESAFPEKQEEQPIAVISGQMKETLVQWLETIAMKKKSYILTNITLEKNRKTNNAAVLFNPHGKLQDTYIKKNTAPLYESRYYTTSNSLNNFEIDNYTIAPLICFDTLFLSNYIRKKMPNLYIAISNDVFAEGTILSKLHQAYGIINARNIGLPFIQITQNGPSFYVNSNGTLYKLADPYEKAIGITFNVE